jgi:hypothetical protein
VSCEGAAFTVEENTADRLLGLAAAPTAESAKEAVAARRRAVPAVPDQHMESLLTAEGFWVHTEIA